ncbi:MAG: hypothetical protein UW21_C0023G0004 [Candidatus Woesebacteria bacterium GW2011_GWB1_44_11b]|uniref:Uncharacterized protein n=1 Tax=Candidatus Woesebacteria bacterium GW2011_GWB1_44_11b TaxID=1618580 RepID=A0A0G1GD76_9BACT|nr:MAG: hypothetical protein UW21_C0023G0004 [Candidatus Woesebacteria bacterium GW2011_GWB1_44_11b]
MSRWEDLNPQPFPYEGTALPLSYIGNSLLYHFTTESGQALLTASEAKFRSGIYISANEKAL